MRGIGYVYMSEEHRMGFHSLFPRTSSQTLKLFWVGKGKNLPESKLIFVHTHTVFQL